MTDPIVVPRELFEQFVDEDDTIRANFDALRADYRILRAEYEGLQNANKTLREQVDRATEVARLADKSADAAKVAKQAAEAAKRDVGAAKRDAEAEAAKRTAEEAESVQKKVEDAVFHLLPALDDLWYAANGTKDAALVKGLSLVIANFDTRLADLGIRRVGAESTVFDPQIHNAVQQVETDLTPPGRVHRELLPGYVAGGRLLRPASVAVAKAPKKKGAKRGA